MVYTIDRHSKGISDPLILPRRPLGDVGIISGVCKCSVFAVTLDLQVNVVCACVIDLSPEQRLTFLILTFGITVICYDKVVDMRDGSSL